MLKPAANHLQLHSGHHRPTGLFAHFVALDWREEIARKKPVVRRAAQLLGFGWALRYHPEPTGIAFPP